MIKQIQFKHVTGSMKAIPGLSSSDCAPKLRMVTELNESGRRDPVLRLVENDVVKVTLLNEEYIGLTDSEKKLPQRVQDALEDRRVEDWQSRVDANDKVRNVLKLFAAQKEIEIIGEVEKTEDEVIQDGSLIVSLSEIAIADHIARGIPIPENLKQKDLPTERVRAGQAKAKQTESE